MNFVETLIKEIGAPVADQLAKEEGITPEQSQHLLANIAPVILAGLKKQQDQGADIDNVITNLGANENSLNDINSFFGKDRHTNSGLTDLLSGKIIEQAAASIGQKSGLSPDVVSKLLPKLTPLILAFLMQKGTQDSSTPTRKTGITAILDRNGDGSIIDDLAGMVLGNQSGAKKQGGGLLAMILAFFNRK